MENIKKEFHIETLLDIFHFIKHKDNSRCGEDGSWLDSIAEYVDLLKHGRITRDLFEGDNAIFEGFKKEMMDDCFLLYGDNCGATVRFCLIIDLLIYWWLIHFQHILYIKNPG